MDRHGIRRWLPVALVLLVPAAAVWALGIRPVRIVTGSMAPTVDPGEWIVVADLDRGVWSPTIRRGDSVLFEYPPDSGLEALKRAAAISGDSVEVAGDSVSVNGRWRPAATPPGVPAPPPGVEQVPPGNVYLLGDNSQASIDSRFFGPVSNDRLAARHLLTLGSTTAVVVKAVGVGAGLGALLVIVALARHRRRVRRSATRQRRPAPPVHLTAVLTLAAAAGCATSSRPALPDETWMDGTFAQVGVAGWYVCGLRPGGEVSCRDTPLVDDHGHSRARTLAGAPPTDRYVGISGGLFSHGANGTHSALDTEYFCGVRASDHSIGCWGTPAGTRHGKPPPGEFSAVAVGIDIACGLRRAGTLTCWGPRAADVPDGPFTSLGGLDQQNTLGSAAPCAIRADGQVWCTGATGRPPHQPSATIGTSVTTLGGDCFLTRTPGPLHCWNPASDTPPPVSFTTITGPGEHGAGCGIADDATVICWGFRNRQSPTGTYSTVQTGLTGTACAIGTDGHLDCWNP